MEEPAEDPKEEVYHGRDSYSSQTMAALPSKDVQCPINRIQSLRLGGNDLADVTKVYAEPIFQAALEEAGVQEPHQGKT